MKLIYTTAVMALCTACTASAGDRELATLIAQGLVAACPTGDSADEIARNDCAGKLTDLAVLRDAMREPFRR